MAKFVDDAGLQRVWNKIKSLLNYKVDKISGKGLSTNDYTTAEKTKLSEIAEGANKTVVDSALSSSSTNPVQNKVINTALAGKASSSHTHTKSQITDFPTSMTPTAHNQASNTITAMTGYSKPSSTSAITTSDNLNGAIGKLEKALDGKANSSHTHTQNHKLRIFHQVCQQVMCTLGLRHQLNRLMVGLK